MKREVVGELAAKKLRDRRVDDPIETLWWTSK